MELQHFGVKGQRWGVIRRNLSRKSSSSSGEPKPKKVGRFKAEINSMKRERMWNKALRSKSKMTDEEINTVVNRVKLENAIKRMGSKKEYLKRADVSDADLKKRVDRLNLENSMKLNVGLAMADQRARGAAVVSSLNNIAMDRMTKASPTLMAAVKKEAQAAGIRAVKAAIMKKTGLGKPMVDEAYNQVVKATKDAKAEMATKKKGEKMTAEFVEVITNRVVPDKVYEPNDSVTTIIRR